MRSISNGLLYFLTFGVAGYAAFAYGVLPLGSLVHPDMKANFLAHPTGIYTHAFAASVALVLGPFQFSARLRKNHAGLHRWLGRTYLAVGVLVGGLAGLYMSRYAFGGLPARLGFVEKDGVGVAATPGDYKAYNVDVLMEKKLGGGALTLEGAYYKYALGSVLDCNSGEPGSPACPAAGADANVGGQVKSKAYYVTAAYLIPGKVGWGQFQPFTRYQKLSRDVSSTTKTQLDVGVNYVIKGHNARITAVFSKVKDDQLPSPKNDSNKFILGTQLQF